MAQKNPAWESRAGFLQSPFKLQSGRTVQVEGTPEVEAGFPLLAALFLNGVLERTAVTRLAERAFAVELLLQAAERLIDRFSFFQSNFGHEQFTSLFFPGLSLGGGYYEIIIKTGQAEEK
jgi:hypothetical protein